MFHLAHQLFFSRERVSVDDDCQLLSVSIVIRREAQEGNNRRDSRAKLRGLTSEAAEKHNPFTHQFSRRVELPSVAHDSNLSDSLSLPPARHTACLES